MKKSFLFVVAVAVTVLFMQNTSAQNTSPYWSLAGNSTATASSKLGTTNNIPLRLFTNNLERVRIDPAGKVGIGINSPIGKLTVFNNGSAPAGAWISAGSPLFVGYGENTVGNGDYILSLASNTYNARGVFIGRRARGTLATPTVVSNNDFLTSILASGYDGSAFQNPATIDFFVDGTPSAGNVPARISFVTGSNSGNRAERLVIKSNGNVGIGTSNPTYKLAVNGTIRSKEVRVETGWADYVFDKNYRLLPLTEVEQFIKTHNHLPGIASAKEIQEDGLAVGEMQTKMMEKIEELTLYIIDLQKQITQLQKLRNSDK